MKDLIRYVCPAPDADLYWGDGNHNQKVLAANDWQTAGAADLADRMGFDITDSTQVTALDGLISDIRDEKAALVGRGCIIIPSGLRHRHEQLFKSLLSSQDALLLVSPGGLRMKFDYRSVFGIMIADVTTISREEGDISPQWIAEWATRQAALCREAFADGWTLAHIAAQIKAFSGDIRNLPFGFYKNNWLNRQGFMTLA